MPRIDVEPIAINKVHGPSREPAVLPIATSSPHKLAEYRSAGVAVRPAPIDVPEIQDRDPVKVVSRKAKEAWRANSGPVVVEDTSFEVHALDGLPGPYTKDFLGSRDQRRDLTRTLSALYPDDRGATFRVLLGMFDGAEVQVREGTTVGEVADAPRGPATFGFDDIFVPHTDDGEETRTYAEMTLEDKNRTSARERALRALKEDPFAVEHRVYQLQEPHQAQVDSIRLEELLAHPEALRFAYDTEVTRHMEPSSDLSVGEFLPYHRVEHSDGAVIEFKLDPDSASQGLVVLPSLDLKRDAEGRPTRLESDITGDPVLLQMGPDQIRMALASRALEFAEMHSDAMHDHIRAIRDGEISHRPQVSSEVLERMLQWEETPDGELSGYATMAVATSEIGYDRVSSPNDIRSRKQAGKEGMFINTKHGPMSMIALGDMPPTGGNKDMLALAALDYMQAWIPRNGVFAGDFDRQLRLFEETKEQIESYDLPDDIKDLCVSRLGIQVGSEDPQQIAEQVAQFQEAGGKSVRIATTNPDRRIIDTAKAIRERVGQDFLIAAGTITDAKQAKALAQDDKGDVDMFFIGHGAGENCTSLEGGGAANSIGILYQLHQDPAMSDRLLFMEGGIGQQYGPLLGLVDGFSMNKKAIGGVESTGGLFAEHADRAKPVIPYHGSASPGTQLVEAYMDDDIGKKRLNPAGRLNANEGKPSYYEKPDWVASSADNLRRQREIIGRALADQAASSIHELRANISEHGHNITQVTPDAHASAYSHRG